MTEGNAKRLKKAFQELASPDLKDTQIDAELYEVRRIKNQLNARTSKKDRALILYCIDSLLEIRKEENGAKLADFAKAIVGVPDVLLGERNLYSLYDDFDAFKQKYGAEYFKKVEKVYPHFTKNAPKNALSFFSRTSDDAFKKKHPVGYVFWLFLA